MTIRVLHLIDALDAGGAEHMAVNLANELALRGHQVTLCTTRRGGPLQSLLSPQVRYYCLNRHSRFDMPPILRLIKLIQNQQVQIIHAHSSSLFISIVISMFIPKVKIIWHDNYGNSALHTRSSILYRAFARQTDGIIAVNQSLVNWAVQTFHIPSNKVWNLPNFVQPISMHPIVDLPGESGYRLVCVANLRPQKDHLTLIRAMKLVNDSEPRAHLILVGANNVPGVKEKIDSEISRLGLIEKTTWLGQRDDIQAILASCTIGVLSSASEGLPLALLEYGWAGLPVVSTRVGACAEVLDFGDAGFLVEPGNPQAMAEQILKLLVNPTLRKSYGQILRDRVQKEYSSETIMKKITIVYQQVLSSDRNI